MGGVKGGKTVLRAMKGVALREELIGGIIKEVIGEEKALTKVSYFKGDDSSKWKNNISTYNIVNLGEIYKGIELKLKAYGSNVEKLFYVKPGAEPDNIKIKISGVDALKVNEEGELEVETGLGAVKFTRPIAYQEEGGKRKYVNVAYIVKGDIYGFKVGEYDRSKELMIDPLLASTFLGGSGDDGASSITIDSAGNVYVAGSTFCSDFPTTLGAYDRTLSAWEDVFVSKFDSSLQHLLASTFLGGSGRDWANSITIDNVGNVYVAGVTYGENPDYDPNKPFPTTPSAYDRTYSGIDDVFVSKFDSSLQNLLASTFLGGSDDDEEYSITIDSVGNVYVAGWTCSPGFPTTPGAYDRTLNGCDAFVSKFNSRLNNLLASTFLNGSTAYSAGVASSITIDSVGNVYVAGWRADGVFVSKFDSSLQNLLASTFLGGSGNDGANSITIDSAGNVYVAGGTDSPDFPTTPSAYDTTYNGYYDVFVSKFDSSLQNLLASTFLGGSGNDGANSITIDSAGNVYVAGGTDSPDFPTTPSAYDRIHNDGRYGGDAFVSKFDSSLLAVVTVISPNGGEIIPSGSEFTIIWEALPEAVKFTLMCSLDNGITWTLINDNVMNTSYNWTVPKPWGNKKKCLVKIIGYDSFNVKVGADKSDAPFTIEVVKLESPNGGVTYTSGDPLTITWTTNGTKKLVAKVKLYYTKDAGVTWIPITTFTDSNPGTFDWTVPTVKLQKNQCKVRVVLIDALGNILAADASDDYFTIKPGGVLLKRPPLGGFYALGTAPPPESNTFDNVLPPLPALIDNNFNTGIATINLSTTRYHNIGILVSSGKSVDRLFIYVNRDVSADTNLTNPSNWRAYKSDSNAVGTWQQTPIMSVTVSAFDIQNNIYRYEIRFSAPQNASYFKAVNMETVNAFGITDVLVTEIEAYGTD
jgi:hypothetical protein